MHVSGGFVLEERPLLCGMCHRRICDIAIFRGDVVLLKAPKRIGIPEKAPTGRTTRITGARPGETPRNPNVRIFEDDSGDRFRIIHEHKGRGPLDRKVNAATLENLYNAAVAAGDDGVVLR
jgi:hypothetical protein